MYNIGEVINMSKSKEELGKQIKRIRQDKGLTMEEFGRLILNAKKNSVSSWESGDVKPNNARIKEIAKVGKISVEELLYDTQKSEVTVDSVKVIKLESVCTIQGYINIKTCDKTNKVVFRGLAVFEDSECSTCIASLDSLKDVVKIGEFLLRDINNQFTVKDLIKNKIAEALQFVGVEIIQSFDFPELDLALSYAHNPAAVRNFKIIVDETLSVKNEADEILQGKLVNTDGKPADGDHFMCRFIKRAKGHSNLNILYIGFLDSKIFDHKEDYFQVKFLLKEELSKILIPKGGEIYLLNFVVPQKQIYTSMIKKDSD